MGLEWCDPDHTIDPGARDANHEFAWVSPLIEVPQAFERTASAAPPERFAVAHHPAEATCDHRAPTAPARTRSRRVMPWLPEGRVMPWLPEALAMRSAAVFLVKGLSILVQWLGGSADVGRPRGVTPWPIERVAGQAGGAHALVGRRGTQVLAAGAGLGHQRAVGAGRRLCRLLE